MTSAEVRREIAAARASIMNGATTVAFDRLRVLAQHCSESQAFDLAIEVLLETATVCAQTGERSLARDAFDQATIVAIEMGYPTDTGAFTYADAILRDGSGLHLEASELFRRAADRFAAESNMLHAMGALSYWAFTVERVYGLHFGARSHVLAAEFIALHQSIFEPADLAMLQATHWLRAADARKAMSELVPALEATIQARNAYVSGNDLEAAARTDVAIGHAAYDLGYRAMARTHWDRAYRYFAERHDPAGHAVHDALETLRQTDFGR